MQRVPDDDEDRPAALDRPDPAVAREIVKRGSVRQREGLRQHALVQDAVREPEHDEADLVELARDGQFADDQHRDAVRERHQQERNRLQEREQLNVLRKHLGQRAGRQQQEKRCETR